MKKILFILLISLFIIPAVKADTISCSNTVNLFDEQWIIGKRFNYTIGSALVIADSSPNAISTNYIEVEPSTTYFFSNNYSIASGSIALLDENYLLINYVSMTRGVSFTTTDTTKYVRFMIGTYTLSESYFNNTWAQLEKGSSQTDYVAYEECIEDPIEPDEPIVADSTLDDFYSIFTSKLKLLANFALENKFVLGAISIVIVFISLEIILNLFNKGGYR